MTSANAGVLLRQLRRLSAEPLSDTEQLGRFAGQRAQEALGANLWMLSVLLALGAALAYQTPSAPARGEQAPTPARDAGPDRLGRPRQFRSDRYGDPLPPGALARLGTVRLRPGNNVRLLRCLPGGKALFSVASDEHGTALCWWDLATGNLLRRGHSGLQTFLATAISPDGGTLVLAGYDRRRSKHRVVLWDVAAGKEKGGLRGTGRRVDAVAFAPDGKTLATAEEDEAIRLWDLGTGAPLRHFAEKRGRFDHLAFSPDGKVLASAGFRRPVRLWDAASGKELGNLAGGPAGSINLLCFSPDRKTLATAAWDQETIRLWDVDRGKQVRQLRGGRGTAALAFSPDGRTLAAGDARVEGKTLERSALRLVDVASGKEVRKFPGHLFGIKVLAFTRDGKRLVSGGVGNVLRVWDVGAGKDLVSFPEHESYVDCVAFAPDGKVLATAGLDGSIRLWEPGAGRPARVFEGGHHQRVWEAAFRPDGRTLVSWGHDGSVRFWDVAAGRDTRRLNAPGDVHDSAFAPAPDGRVLALWTKDRGLRLVDWATGKQLRRIPCDTVAGVELHFAPDSNKLAVMSYPGRGNAGVLHLWDVATGKELRKWDVAPAGQFAFSPDGRTLAGIDGGFVPRGTDARTLHLWDTATGKERTLIVAVRPRVFSVAYSPDGRVLALGTADGPIHLLELASGQVRRLLEGHQSFVISLAYAPDGRTLASGSADTTALVWDVSGWAGGAAPGPLAPGTLRALWADLAAKDAGRADVALRALAADPVRAVPFLGKNLRPAATADPRQAARLLADLDSERFATRQKAAEELRKLGERAEAALREALRGPLPLEARKSVEQLLEEVESAGSSPERLRPLRAVEVLEHAGTPQARKVLRLLAGGARGARLTGEARAALRRLDRHSGQAGGRPARGQGPGPRPRSSGAAPPGPLSPAGYNPRGTPSPTGQRPVPNATPRRCPKQAPFSPRVKVWLEIDGDYAFGFGVAEILRAVDRAGSIKQAAADLGRSYRYVWGRIKRVERVLGRQLVETQVGGQGAQRSTLTAEARRLADAFLDLRRRMFQVVEQEFACRFR